MTKTIEKKINALVDELIELENKIDTQERCIKNSLAISVTYDLHVQDLERYEKTYNRKMKLLELLKGEA